MGHESFLQLSHLSRGQWWNSNFCPHSKMLTIELMSCWVIEYTFHLKYNIIANLFLSDTTFTFNLILSHPPSPPPHPMFKLHNIKHVLLFDSWGKGDFNHICLIWKNKEVPTNWVCLIEIVTNMMKCINFGYVIMLYCSPALTWCSRPEDLRLRWQEFPPQNVFFVSV